MKRIKSDPIGWHVIARGARRLELFRDEQDFDIFLSILRFSLLISGLSLWAITLMSNHYHMVVYGSSDQLTACMFRLNKAYSRYHNRKYGLVGHAFDGPYKAYRQPTPILLLRTIAYVFMNPVVAGIVQAPDEYPWSCVRSYLGLPGSAIHVDPSEVMRLVHNNPAEAWARFHRAMERQAKLPKRQVPDRLTRTQIQAQQFEWLLEHAREIQSTLQGEDPTTIAVCWARQCGITPRAMVSALGWNSTQPIYNILRREFKRLTNDPMKARLLTLP